MSEGNQPPDDKKPVSARWREFNDWLRSWPLLGKIIAWVLLAMIGFAIALWALLVGGDSNFLAGGGEPLNKTAAALTMVGGIGAVTYLVIKYQERIAAQREEERQVLKQDNEDMLTAIHLLGDDKPSTRIAGVQYLLQAGQTRPQTRQQVMDILCGYLRTSRQDDASVESTILKAMKEHLTQTKASNGVPSYGERYWDNIDLDLHGSVIREWFDFSSIVCNKVDLSYARLETKERVNFSEATINFVNFKGMKTDHNISFNGVHFPKHVDFSEAILDGACFSDASLDDVSFDYTSLDEASFSNASLECVSFDNASLDNASFDTATLHGVTISKVISSNSAFGGARLKGVLFDEVKLHDAIFIGAETVETSFMDAAFQGGDFRGASFDNVSFERACLCSVSFESAPLHDVSFEGASLHDVSFEGASLHDVSFADVTFDKSTSPANPSIYVVDFEKSTFEGNADFQHAVFQGVANFSDASFNCTIQARGVKFKQPPLSNGPFPINGTPTDSMNESKRNGLG